MWVCVEQIILSHYNSRNKGLRIQAKEHHQNAPNGPDVDLFTGIHHKVVAFSEEVDSHCIHSKVNQPLVLHKEP